eukprot:COSAG01_NODE_7580_length_3140_cov_11.391976_4_plen_88_part_00
MMAWLSGSNTKNQVAAALGEEISSYEWAAATRHAVHPGVFKPVLKRRYTAMRCSVDKLERLLAVLEGDDVMQKYAYGERECMCRSCP